MLSFSPLWQGHWPHHDIPVVPPLHFLPGVSLHCLLGQYSGVSFLSFFILPQVAHGEWKGKDNFSVKLPDLQRALWAGFEEWAIHFCTVKPLDCFQFLVYLQRGHLQGVE